MYETEIDLLVVKVLKDAMCILYLNDVVQCRFPGI